MAPFSGFTQWVEGRRHDRLLEEWLELGDTAAQVVARALGAWQGRVSTDGLSLSLNDGERYVGSMSANLVMPKTRYSRTTVGGSTRVGERSRVGASQSVVTSSELPEVVDYGTVFVTDQRVVFVGRTRTFEWPFRRILSWQHSRNRVTIHLSGRQRSYGFTYGRSENLRAKVLLDVANALYADDATLGVWTDSERLAATIEAAPRARGGSADPRVEEALSRWRAIHASYRDVVAGIQPPTPERARQLPPATRAPILPSVAGDAGAKPREPLPAGRRQVQVLGVGRLPAKALHLSLMSLNVSNVLVSADSIAALDQNNPSVPAPWTLVLDGVPPGLDMHSRLFMEAERILICLPTEELRRAGFIQLDEARVEADLLGFAESTVEQVQSQLKAQGGVTLHLKVRQPLREFDMRVIDAACLLGPLHEGLLGRVRVAVVMSGTLEHLETTVRATTIADTVAVVASAEDLNSLGIPIMDAPLSVSHEDEDLAPRLPARQVGIAGRLRDNASEAIAQYLVEHAGTVEHYDLRAGTFDEVNLDLIRATRRPWMNSRIGSAEADWFIQTARTAPFERVPANAHLKDADPTLPGGLYDQMLELWKHFETRAPKRVASAKISKVLYLMRPHAFPILDSRLIALYRQAASAAAKDISVRRPEVASGRNFWEAIRRDLVAASPVLTQIRDDIRGADIRGASDRIDQISDVRLLDMLSWPQEPATPEDD